MKTLVLLVIWYLVCILLLLAWRWFWRFTNLPRFREEDGDVTTEVGYEEDSTGKPLHESESEDHRISPHIAFGADHHTGSSMF
jgi:hypothetical protein